MKKIIILSVIMISCSPKYIPVKSDTEIQYIETIKDSIVYLPIPIERESNIIKNSDSASDISFVQTSLAISEAWIDSEGILYHNIRNKHEKILPISIKYVDKARLITTIKDVPIYIKGEKVIKEVVPRWAWIMLTCVMLYLGYKFYMFGKNRGFLKS